MTGKYKTLLEPGKMSIWFLCEIPLLLVLIFTAAADPAAGYEPGSREFLVYIPAAAVTVVFSLLLNWIKGFLVLHFTGTACSLMESAELFGRIHCVMAIAEAFSNLILFLLRNRGIYQALSQIQLFGHELLYAFLFWLWLREKSEASYKRCLTVSVICFLASSAWLMLSVIAAI